MCIAYPRLVVQLELKVFICNRFVYLCPLFNQWPGVLKTDRFFGECDRFEHFEKLSSWHFHFYRNSLLSGCWFDLGRYACKECLEKWFTNSWSETLGFLFNEEGFSESDRHPIQKMLVFLYALLVTFRKFSLPKASCRSGGRPSVLFSSLLWMSEL